MFSLVNSPDHHLLTNCFDKDRDFLHHGHWSVSDHGTKMSLEGVQKQKGGYEKRRIYWGGKLPGCVGVMVILGFFRLKIRVTELLSFILQAQPVPSVLCAVWPGKCWATETGAAFSSPCPCLQAPLVTFRWLMTKPTAVVVI